MAKILVVEDEPDILDMISRFLERRGHAVIRATTGQQGASLLASQAPTLLLIDQHLPDCLGLELVAQTRRLASAAGLKTLLITGDSEPLRRPSSDIDSFLSKPFSLGELGNSVDRLLP